MLTVRHVLCLLMVVSAPLIARADTSATLPTAINIPSGPASLEGFGQGHDISPASGLPSLAYPLVVPPGRAGLQPELALHYNAGSGAGVLGLGWSLDLPAIERSTRAGVPRHDGTDPWTLRHLGDSEELIPVAPGEYRQRIEQGSPIFVRDLAGGGMAALTTDGTGLLFGLDEDARLEQDGAVFRLELSAITDPHGNRLDFHYTREPGTDAPLLAAITYNDGHAAVRLDYEPRPDLVISHAAGFRVALAHRLSQITTEVDGRPVRTTTLTYDRTPTAPSSLLAEIDTVAADGSRLPGWHLEYTRLLGTSSVQPHPILFNNGPALDPTGEGRAWLDIDGDALPDLLEGTPGAWRYRKNQGLARGLAAEWTTLGSSPSVEITGSARFADLTGDGVQDLLVQAGDSELRAFTGGGAAPFATTAPIALDISFDLTDPRVALADLNLDGRVDVLRHDDADAWLWRRHLDSPGYAPAEPVPPPPPGMRLGNPGVQLVDIHGDRLPDLVRLMPSERRILVAAGEGLGLFAVPEDMHEVPALAENERWELADINGDGAADLVHIASASISVHLNQLDLSFAEFTSISWPALESDEVVILSDVDASGTVDVLRADTDGSQPWRVWSFASTKPGVLERLGTDLGYQQSFIYSPAAELAADDAAAGDPWTTTAPEPMPVLVEVHERDDGSGWSNTTRHHVRDGWYDPARGEFRGFSEQRVELRGDPYTEASTQIDRFDLGQTDEARKLQLLTSETRGPRGPLVREEHTLDVTELAPGVRACRRVASDTLHLEAGPEADAARTRIEWDHDDLGNVLEERAFGRVDRSTGADIPGDERITTNTYATPTEADAPRDALAEQVITDADGRIFAGTRTYFDGPAERGLPLGQVGPRGAVARIETWIEGDTWITSRRQALDAHGNITRLRDAEGGTMTRRHDELGLFPIEEHIHLDDGSTLTTVAIWDARSGTPTEITTPNGATSAFTFDGLGRLTAEIEPGDSVTFPTRRYQYHLDGATQPPAIVTELRKISGEPDTERITQHLDALGRPRARVTADDAGTAAIVAEAQIYTSTGKIAQRLAPRPAAASALTPGSAPDPFKNGAWPRGHFTYDALGRPLTERDADGRDTATRYGPLWTDRRDHEDLHPSADYRDTPERTVLDGLGRTIAVEDHIAGRAIRHGYAHDPADRITAHTDPAGHVIRYEHDGAGRLIAIDSPDAGRVVQRFDATGRILERITATGARITWSYDQAGRTLRERAFSPAGDLERESTRTYDRTTDPAARFERGQLTAVEDDAGRLELVHDARGQVIRTARTFAAHAGPIALSASTEYDAQGRPLRETYPDGTSLERAYTARGLEAPLLGWLDAAAHDPAGRWTSLTFATGDITLARELDQAGRQLRELVTSGAATLRDLTHHYDPAGLLAETRDHVGPTPEGPALDTQHRFDDLHRLIESRGPHGRQSFTYTDDDNLASLSGAAFIYHHNHPHAVTRARGQTLEYDAAGQLARVSGAGDLSPGTWHHDPHGRLRTFTADDGRRTEHIYDHSGDEAIRREFTAAGDLVHETLYFGDNIEARDGRLVRWVSWAGQRLAESPTGLPKRGYPLAPLALIMVFGAAALVRHPRGRVLHALTALALGLVSAVSCQHDSSAASLTPDADTRIHIADRLGSAALILDHHGEIVARDTHAPFGQASASWRAERQTAPTYRFTGAEDLTLAGAITIGARQYLPTLGRWASPDPYYLFNPAARLEDPGERNLYRYAANNPVHNLDPSGHGWFSAAVKLAKATVKAITKGVDKVDEFSGMVDDVVTVVGREAGLGARVLSTLSLASEILPVSAGDLKSAYRWARGGDKTLDAASKLRQTKVQKALPERAGPVGHLSHSDVHGKTPAEIDARAKQIGLVPRGKDPMHDRGAYIDPVTKRERMLSHPLDKSYGPHGHVNDPQGNRLGPNNTPVHEKSPEAHIPINWDKGAQP